MISDIKKNKDDHSVDLETVLKNTWIFKPAPVVKWAGGKRQLLNKLRDRYPDRLKKGLITTYLEPFCGGAAVFFDIYSSYTIVASSKALASDSIS